LLWPWFNTSLLRGLLAGNIMLKRGNFNMNLFKRLVEDLKKEENEDPGIWVLYIGMIFIPSIVFLLNLFNI